MAADPTQHDDPGAGLRLLAEAVQMQQQRRFDDAERIYRKLIARDPPDPIALINAGVLALTRGDDAAAIDRLGKAVELVPANAVALNNLGFALIRAGRDGEALGSLERAVANKPDYAQAHNNRGIALARLGRTGEAIEAFRRALALQLRYAEAEINLGEQYRRLGEGRLAREAFERALELAPGEPAAAVGAAFAIALEGDVEGGIAALELVVAAHPGHALAWQNLGTLRNWAWRHAEAHDAFARAAALDPRDADTRFGLAATLLAQGRYLEGFEAFEQRPDGLRGQSARFPGVPVWHGEPLAGTLLLHGEQGLGDVVQFCRFVPMLRARVGEIALLLDGYWAPLAPLLASLAGVDRIVEDASQTRPAARASILSLPHLAGANPSCLAAKPYLRAPDDRRARWQANVESLPGVRVGLAWSVTVRGDHPYVTRQKSIPAHALAPLLDVPGVSFVSLQPGEAGKVDRFGARASEVSPLGQQITDFGDTAALIEALDLVVTPDTAVAHVAGALGKPVWMLDRLNGCWRWRLEVRSSPWYPSMRIFRQRRVDDWSVPVEEAAAELRALAGGR